MSELPNRVYELPPPGADIELADSPETQEADSWLQSRGYRTGPVTSVHSPADRLRLWEPPGGIEAAGGLLPGRALSIACGTGREAVWLADRGWTVTAFDPLPDAIERGRLLESRYRNPEATPIQWEIADAAWLERLDADSLDLVTSFMFYTPELEEAMNRVLTPGGTGIISCWSAVSRSQTGHPKSRDRAFPPKSGIRLPVTVCPLKDEGRILVTWTKQSQQKA